MITISRQQKLNLQTEIFCKIIFSKTEIIGLRYNEDTNQFTKNPFFTSHSSKELKVTKLKVVKKKASIKLYKLSTIHFFLFPY